MHAILRRQDDTYCDPLELRSDSALGVAGLTDCARRGNVLIANALGSGVIESGALLGFLPRLCEQLTGEALRLPSIATWWCGEPAALAMRSSSRSNWYSNRRTRRSDLQPVFGEDLDEAGLAALAQTLKREPERYIAQEFVHVSQAPVLARNRCYRIGARGIGLRVFAMRIAARIRGDARRAHAGRQRRGRARRFGAARRRLQGYLGDLARLRRHQLYAAAKHGDRAGTWCIPERESRRAWRRTCSGSGAMKSAATIRARLLRLALNQILSDSDDDEDSFEPVLALARAFSLIEKEEDAETALLAAATQEKNVIRTARQPAQPGAGGIQSARPHVPGQLAHHQRARQGSGFRQGNLACRMRSIGSIAPLPG